MALKDKLQIIPTEYFEEYKAKLKVDISACLKAVEQTETDFPKFDFYTSISATFSSKIEGEDIDVDSYLKYKFLKVKYKPNYTRRTDDLLAAYQFAAKHKLTLANLLKSHCLISKHLIPASQRGIIRIYPELIMDNNENIVYVAASPQTVKAETEKLFADISLLLKAKLSLAQTFYFAAFIHMVFEKIHPFIDGNGRAGRLLEKWFLASKIGEKAWFIKSEKYYYQNLNKYYKNIDIGKEYEELKYTKCLPFLLMLVESLKMK